jgi:hypothetical protein
MMLSTAVTALAVALVTLFTAWVSRLGKLLLYKVETDAVRCPHFQTGVITQIFIEQSLLSYSSASALSMPIVPAEVNSKNPRSNNILRYPRTQV